MSNLPINFPLIKAADVDNAMATKGHYLNAEAKRTGVCMSDMVGMQGLGVHKVKLPPNGESTRIHYHLNDSEWLYVLSGSGVLQLIDASLPPAAHPRRDAAPIGSTSTSDSGAPEQKWEIKDHPISTGDFMGFHGGITASKFAHGLKAGEEGIEYLMGGTRERIDVCCYPEVGVSNVFENWKGEETSARVGDDATVTINDKKD